MARLLCVIDAYADEVQVVPHLLFEDAVVNEPVDLVSVVHAYSASDFDNVKSLSGQLMHFVCMTDGALYLNVVHEPFP
jgi:hypothetical protein